MRYCKFQAVVLALFIVPAAARADVIAVVSAKSSVSALTRAQVADLFLGKANSFPDGSPAVPIDLGAGTPERDEFYDKFTGKSAAQLKSYWAKQIFSGKGTPPKEAAGPGEVKKLIANNPNAIGYIEKSSLDGSVKPVTAP